MESVLGQQCSVQTIQARLSSTDLEVAFDIITQTSASTHCLNKRCGYIGIIHVFHALTFTEVRGRCLNTRRQPSVQNSSEDPANVNAVTLTNMFDHYSCIYRMILLKILAKDA